jgi:hypothetical protein
MADRATDDALLDSYVFISHLPSAKRAACAKCDQLTGTNKWTAINASSYLAAGASIEDRLG